MADTLDMLPRYQVDGNGELRGRADGDYVKLADVRAAIASRSTEVDERMQALAQAEAQVAHAQERRKERCDRLGIAQVEEDLRKAAKFLLDRYDDMRKKGAPTALELEILRAALIASIDGQLHGEPTQSNDLPCLLCKLNHGRGCWAHK